MRRLIYAVVIASTGVAAAQPADPYGDPAPPAAPPAPPAPAPTPPPPTPDQPADPYGPPEVTQEQVLAEQIAESLVQRAQDLYDARVFVDAKQLAVEALVASPKGAAADHAKFLIAAINKQLGISDGEAPKVEPPPPPPVLPPPVMPPPDEGKRGAMVTPARVHGALYLGLVGTTIGSLFSKDSPATGAVPVGLVGAAGGALLAPLVTEKLGWSDAQIRTAGTGSVWLGVAGGLIADAVKTDGTTARHVLAGASIGSTIGLFAGAGLATRNNYTEGDIALVDTMAGIGVFGGFTIGMLMQPAESEAYSVNAILGAAGGLVVGLVAAPNTNTTPRRMLRVAGLAAAGGGIPFLLYAGIHDPSTTADERVVGLLSTVGILAGAYVGFRLTRDMDVDLDVKPGTTKEPVDDAPPAVLGRSSSGRWGLGMLGIAPLSRELAPQPGLALPLVGATW